MNLGKTTDNLSAEQKRVFLAQLLARKEASKFRSFPLSFAQQRLWFLAQMQPGSGAYNLSNALHLRGSLNIVVLEKSLNEIIRRHEALRTTFVAVNGQPVQNIAPSFDLALPLVDLRQLPKGGREEEVKHLATQSAHLPFDLAQGLLLRVTLLQLAEAEYVVLLTVHHIVFDTWSMGVLVRELATLYKAFLTENPSPLPKLPIQYADFAVWQRQWLQGDILKKQLTYWQQQLAGSPALQLPTDRPRPSIQTFRGAKQSFSPSHDLIERLKTLSRQEGVTLFITLLATFNILLHRYSGQDDIVVGSPIANRNRTEIEGLIGFFVNTLVLRTDLSGNPSFRQLLKRVREIVLEAHDNQYLPFEYLVEVLQPQRSLSHNPLFQVEIVLLNAPMEELLLPELTLSSVERESLTARFDLTLWLEYTTSGMVASLEYNTDMFDASTITRMLGHFQILLEGIVANPEQRLSDLPLLTAAEHHQLLVEWNDTQADYPKGQCIHQLFEAQVKRTPDAVALVFEDEQLSYQELNIRANQLAKHLQKLGVGPEVLVGICVERSIDMVVGLLGILKAGGAYVPLDPAYPQERLAFMLADSQVPVLVTQQHLVSRLPEHDAQVLWLVETDWYVSAEENSNTPLTQVGADNLAYVIYTSGSTGRSKGVAIEHHSTVALLDWAKATFAPEQLAGVLASTSICFDLSVFELFVPLSWGGKVILAENALHLSTLSAAKDVTLINTVPSALAELLRVEGLPRSVHTVNLAGEPLQNKLVQQLYQQDTIQQVSNLYGPSEDTTYSTFALVKREASKSPTIGRPVANTQIYILDSHLQPQPVGVPGELHISGAGLARGYLHRPELNAEKFIFNPFTHQAGARLYKTGDLARYLPNGNIEFLGRIDHQVKVRGFRIEPGEIEAVLGQHQAVREVVVTAREDEPGNKRLVAYTVPQSEQAVTINELRHFLEDKLPNYMVPSAFVMLETLPLAPNGKVDRQALPEPEALRPELEVAFVMPQTELEQTIANVWKESLNIEKIGIHDNFFEVGGHSLLMVKVHSEIIEMLKADFSIVEMFRYPTISSLAEYLNQTSNQTQFSLDTDIIRKKIKTGKAQQKKRIQKMKSI